MLPLTPVFSSAESFGELSDDDDGSDEIDEGYPPIEKMFIPPRGETYRHDFRLFRLRNLMMVVVLTLIRIIHLCL